MKQHISFLGYHGCYPQFLQLLYSKHLPEDSEGIASSLAKTMLHKSSCIILIQVFYNFHERMTKSFETYMTSKKIGSKNERGKE